MHSPTRSSDEALMIGDTVTADVLQVRGYRVRSAVNASRGFVVRKLRLAQTTEQNNRCHGP